MEISKKLSFDIIPFNVLPEIADAKNLHSHLFVFVFFFLSKSGTWFSIFQYAAIEKHSAKICIPKKVLLNKAFLRQKSLVNEVQFF